MKKEILIFGGVDGQGHVKVCIDILQICGYTILGLIGKEGTEKGSGKILGVPVLGGDSDPHVVAYLRNGVEYFVAIGDNVVREKVTEQVKKMTGGREPVNAVHPDVTISRFAEIGHGNFINCGVRVNAGARIGNHTVINTSATVDHDNVIEDYVQLSPGVHLAGNVTVARGAFVGTKAAVIPWKKIGAGSIVGAGAVVINDVPEFVTVVGVPARVIKRHQLA